MSIDKLGKEIQKLADMVIKISDGSIDGNILTDVTKYIKKHKSIFENMSDIDKGIFNEYIREMKEKKDK